MTEQDIAVEIKALPFGAMVRIKQEVGLHRSLSLNRIKAMGFINLLRPYVSKYRCADFNGLVERCKHLDAKHGRERLLREIEFAGMVYATEPTKFFRVLYRKPNYSLRFIELMQHINSKLK